MIDERFIIFGRSSCNFCIMAADYCSALKQDYVFLDYEDQQNLIEEYKNFYDQKTVPIILLNNKTTGLTRKLGGYTDLLEYFETTNGEALV